MMKRAARRRLKKAGIDEQDIAIMIQDSINLYSVATIMILHDKWGFGKVRLTRFLDQLYDLLESIEQGYLTVEDCKKVLLEECKINFR